MTRIFVTSRLSASTIAALGEKAEVESYERSAERPLLPEEEFMARLAKADILVTEADQITASVLERCPKLRMVVATRGDPINVDIDAATEHGVLVTNTPGRNAQAVTELTVALMIMCARRILPARDAMLEGKWANKPKGWIYLNFQGHELNGRVAGLVGMGAIGRKVTKLLLAFGMQVLAYDPYLAREQAESLGVELTGLDDLFRRSDFVSLHAPVTKGKAQFSVMKSSAILINSARAALVDEQAMLDALKTKRIAGAGLDVFHREPLAVTDPILALDNVVAIPHIGGATNDVIRHQSEMVYGDISAFLDGQPPQNLVNRSVVSKPAPPRT
jgi:phosphoglycerate dehydrogenase-like enzyme